MNIGIKDIAYYLPEKILTNDELLVENPTWDMKRVEERSGVLNRHVAGQDETALDLAYNACLKLFSNPENDLNQLDCIIFCTQSEDYIMPPNSTVLHGKLGLSEDVFAFDFNLACSGFIYGLSLARGLLLSGQVAKVLLVNADTYTKFIHKQDRSARVLFGDGASVTLITKLNDSAQVVDIICATSGKNFEKFIIPAGACRLPSSEDTILPKRDKSGNVRTLENIHMDGFGVLSFFNTKVPSQVSNILDRNKLDIEEIDFFVFHQASKLVLDYLTEALKLDPEKVFRNIESIGNTVSASIPIGLKQAQDKGIITQGDRVLISGFGVGLSWGTAILQY